MKISFCASPCKNKENERRHLEVFLYYYLENYLRSSIENIEVSCPDHIDRKAKAPDFYIKNLDMVVEIKKIISEMTKNRDVSSSHNKNRLQKALNSFSAHSKYKGKNIFLSYPFEINIKKGKEKIIAQEIYEKILEGNDYFKIDEVGNFKVIHRKPSNDLRIILAMTDFALDGIKVEQLIGLILRANVQLNNFSTAKKKILLLIEKEQYVALEEYEEAMKDVMRKIGGKISINEIWLQIDREPSIGSHHCLWKSPDM